MRVLFDVTTSTGSHPVALTDAPLDVAVAATGAHVVIADAFFRGQLDSPVVWIDAVEESKELAQVPAIVEACRRAGLTRDGGIVAVGGGVVQDIACFVASIYMRGVAWHYLPTTLLGMVDSCIGGKSSINVGEFKNLAGTFHPPAQVVVPPAVLATLPPEHIAAGRAEAAKICFAAGGDAFDRYLAIAGDGFRDPTALVSLSLATKKWFVETDEFDRAERLLLNFGHSFGHAIESCTGYAVPHGVAVGVGCIAAVAMRGATVRGDLLVAQLRAILSAVSGLSAALAEVTRDAFFRYWNSDKKHSHAFYRPILIDADGTLHRVDLPRDAASEERIWAAFAAARDQLDG